MQKDYLIGGIKMKITDIQNLVTLDSKNLVKKPLKSKKTPKKNHEVNQSQSLFGGMTADAHTTFQSQKFDMTKEEIGVNERTKIIIPSFNTTSKLFTQHFQILRELKHKIDLLK
mmetsp:Transcript_11438/g.17228  ORF Transcript_11438/g.17228 Transcript_11438/m.17228 type:complete len:114 (-) Transcript_11438:317-658(-)